ncbi:PHA/PHB synthase family protein [Epibacterium ulvae]|uniref:PHA/PHB synthase family protein n=1 Tax=Epibacterium ulvae TaxID=1156985 RepID=UPI00249357F2|nr:class I poly(R)-hydroxyalkanoic acid synthase [Epibacterium ulvae]
MTTSEDVSKVGSPEHVDLLKENMSRVDELSKRLAQAVALKEPHNPGLDGPNQELFARAATAYWAEMWQNPARLMEQQAAYWGQTMANFAEAQNAAKAEDEISESAISDRRFSHGMWESNPYFRYIKQQYLTNANAIHEAVEEVDELEPIDKKRLRYFADQIVQMMAPTNFLATNPEALERALETDGQSLVDGLENLVADLEANNGEMIVRLVDENAFEVGGNLATTPGDVVFRNKMLELIQYRPTTETVHQTPIVMFPPWINKYYILDLKEKNSFVKWVTDQGYTLFVVSWVNPDESYADVGMEEYIQDGYLKVIDVVKEICDVPQINAIGYCIAGTTLSLTLALLKARGDKSIKSATFFTTLTDFSDQGEFTPFLQNDFIDGIEEQVSHDGILKSWIMARTFSFLRSNDLIYRPAIRSYMMGEAPPAFDLLFWNGDGSNLPGKMAMQYLRGLCQRNEFAEEGFELLGETLKLKDVDVPLMAISCETDHIAQWTECLRGVQQMGSRSKTFVVSQSGHIAGIVNPPSRNKYGHYTNTKLKGSAAEWMEGATFNEGSWWPLWSNWLKKRSGKQVPARKPGSESSPALQDAPGSYILIKATD